MLGAGHVSAATAPDTTPRKALIPVEAGQLGRADSAPMCRGHAAGAAEAQTPAWATQCYSKHKGCGSDRRRSRTCPACQAPPPPICSSSRPLTHPLPLPTSTPVRPSVFRVCPRVCVFVCVCVCHRPQGSDTECASRERRHAVVRARLQWRAEALRLEWRRR